MATEQSSDSDPAIISRLASVLSPEPEVAQEVEAAPAEVTTEEPETPEETSDVEDLDVDGEIYKVPPSLKAKVSEWKEGSLRRDDYTRKTQELADITRQAQLAAEAIQTRQAFEQEISTERTELNRVQADIERYKAVDWSSLDVETYVKLRGQFDSLKEKATELNGKIGEKAQQLQGKLTEHRQRLIEEGQKFLQKSIKNWGPEAQQAAKAGAREVGYTDGELENVYDARFAALSWKAAQYDKLQSGRAEAVKKAQAAPPVIKPGATVPGAATQKAYKDARARLKGDGSLESAIGAMRLLQKTRG